VDQPDAPPRCYALRRVNPYRGVAHVVDTGDAHALTYDGHVWYLRNGDGRPRPTGIWMDGAGLRTGQNIPQALLSALEQRPPLPFPCADSLELWLLDKERGLPLALLATERPSAHRTGRIDPEWYPFVLSYTGFISSTLAIRDADLRSPPRHRDLLARIVNRAARPYPAAQWFKRLPDGGGEGLAGLRLETPWRGRILEKDAFPELLVRESWNIRLEQSVINDYHLSLAPILLLLPELTDATRNRLEVAAHDQPAWLARIHRLLPRVMDPRRLSAALVAARLESAAGKAGNELMDS
jgi:hypothetical protein